MSLRQHFLFVTLLTSGIGVLIGFGVFLGFDLHDVRVQTLEVLNSTADLIGTNAAAALEFDDEGNGAKLLEALRTHNDVRTATLFRPDGQPFARYVRPGLTQGHVSLPASQDQVTWTKDTLSIVRPIKLDQKLIGRIGIDLDLDLLKQRTRFNLILTAVISAVVLSMVYVLTVILGRAVTRPIRELAATARAIASGQDYTRRAPDLRGRELRQLGADFNSMLAEISRRDAALVEARDQLEQRVADRTSELRDQIWERERTELLLSQSERMFRTLSAAAPIGIVLISAGGAFTYVNEAWREMSGLSFQEALGSGWRVVVHPDDLERVEQIRNSAIARRQDYALGYRMQTKNGIINVECVARTMTGDSGELSGYVAVVQDVTERQKAADNLRMAKEAAEAANRAKSDFLANMSHEIRTPMNGIIGMTELALDTQLDPEQRDYLNMVKSSADALLAIINDILDFSKIEAGRMELESSVFSLHSCIEEALRPLALRAHQKGLELTWFVDQDVPEYLRGDVTRLRQILINLSGNAIKFTRVGHVSIHAKRIAAPQGHVALEVTVADTGIGIPPEKHKSIFAAFTQADASTTREFGGTGLGLSISARLVKLMGGEVSLESEPGKGTKFSFTAKFGTVTEAEIPSLPASDPGLRGLRALIVDDNEINRKLLERLLPAWHISAKGANNGAEALALFHEYQRAGTPFDVVLMDKNMPELSGYDTTRRLRALPGGENIPVLILTSSPVPEDLHEHAELKIAKRISKPILREDLLEAIRLAVHGSVQKPAPEREEPSSVEFARPLRIVLAEDNAVNQKLATRLLEKVGHRVSLAANGREAVELVAAGGYDMVLMDIQMPVMGGVEATRLIRESEEQSGKRIPIVAMTANALKGDEERYIASGMDGYVSKPIRTELLHGEIARVMQALDGSIRRHDESSANSNAGGAAFDREEFLNRIENDDDLAREILEIFQNDSTAYLKALQTAVASEDVPGIRTTAHVFNGMLANLSTRCASESAARLEALAKAGSTRELHKAACEFELELSRVLAEVEHLLAEAKK